MITALEAMILYYQRGSVSDMTLKSLEETIKKQCAKGERVIKVIADAYLREVILGLNLQKLGYLVQPKKRFIVIRW